MNLTRWTVSVADKSPYYGHAIFIRVVATCTQCSHDNVIRTSGEAFNHYVSNSQQIHFALKELGQPHQCKCGAVSSLSPGTINVIGDKLRIQVTDQWISARRRRLWKKADQQQQRSTAARHLRAVS